MKGRDHKGFDHQVNINPFSSNRTLRRYPVEISCSWTSCCCSSYSQLSKSIMPGRNGQHWNNKTCGQTVWHVQHQWFPQQLLSVCEPVFTRSKCAFSRFNLWEETCRKGEGVVITGPERKGSELDQNWWEELHDVLPNGAAERMNLSFFPLSSWLLCLISCGFFDAALLLLSSPSIIMVWCIGYKEEI